MRAHSARSTTVLIGLVLTAAVALVVSARVTGGFPGSVGAAAVVVVAALVFVWLIRTRRTEQRAATWAAGALGEELVAAELARLPDDFVVLNNLPLAGRGDVDHVVVGPGGVRSEEHTFELQSLSSISYAVFCLDRKSVV